MNRPGDTPAENVHEPEDVRVNLEAHASGHGRIYQALRDVHVHYRDGVSGARRTDGPVQGVCPYPGLAAFGPEHSQWFFGRDRLVAELTDRLADRLSIGGLLMVVAPSGAGKSSLLRAGLMPALARGTLPPPDSAEWPCIVLTPTADPMGGLASHIERLVGTDAVLCNHPAQSDPGLWVAMLRSALRKRHGSESGTSARVVLIIDQLEELFTLCTDEAVRRCFIEVIARLATSGNDGDAAAALVVCGLRADFYAPCADYTQLRSALQEGQVLIGPMSAAELREAILYPARAVELTVEPGLIELLLRDLGTDNAGGYEAGRLPLLAHALRATWQQRHGHTLTVDGYQVTGGIHQAVARSAEQVFTRLEPAAQDAARSLFLRLVKIGDSTEDTRRRATRADLLRDTSEPAAAAAALDACTRGRLLTQERDTVEITHEALLRAWPRLKAWIDQDRAGNLIRQELEEAATAWNHAKHDSSTIYRGTRLDAASAWATQHPRQLSRTAGDFLNASRRQQRRTSRLRSSIIATLTVLAVLASTTAIVALQQRASAQAARSEALQQRDQAIDNQITAEAGQLQSTDPSLAAELNLVAYHRQPAPGIIARLLSTESVPLSAPLTSATFVNSAIFSPDGRTLALGSNDTVQLWNMTNPSRPALIGRPLTGQSDTVLTVAFSPNGRILASGSVDGTIQLWNVTSPGRPTPIGPALKVRGQDPNVLSVAFSPDGQTLASGSQNGTIELWNLTNPARPTLIGRPLADSNGWAGPVKFSPDGRTLACGDLLSRTVRLWNVADPARPAPIGQPIQTSGLGALAFSPAGGVLATGSETGTVQLWNVTNPAQAVQIGQPLLGHTNSIDSLAFSLDGRILASGSSDDTIRLWNVTNPAQAVQIGQPLLGHTNSIHSLAFSPDGRTLASSSSDGTVRLWNLSQPVLLRQPDEAEAVAFSPNSPILASTSDIYVQLWNVADPAHPSWAGRLKDPSAQTVAFSPDGRILASGSLDGTIRLWNITSLTRPTLVSQFRVHPTNLSDVKILAFSPDGRILASGSSDGTIRLFNVANPARPSELGQPLIGFSSYSGINLVSSIAFSPSGGILASAQANVRLWDIANPAHPKPIGQPLTTSSEATSAIAFSPNGHTLAEGNTDGTIELWNVTNPAYPVLTREPLVGHTNSVDSVAFSPDGRTLASGSLDDTVRLWDVTDPAQPEPIGQSLTGHTSFVTSVAYSPNGRILASGSLDDTIRLWNLNSAIQRICAATGNTLTPQAWALYIPQLPYDPPCSN